MIRTHTYIYIIYIYITYIIHTYIYTHIYSCFFLVPNLKTYIKDDYDFLRNYLHRHLLKALYIHVILFGIEAISYWLHKKLELIPLRFTNDFIIESLKLVLTMFYLIITCTFNYLEQQWAQNVLPRMLVNFRLFRRDKTFYQIYKTKLQI